MATNILNSKRTLCECPFCGCQSVQAKIMTTFCFQKVTSVYKDGVDGVTNDVDTESEFSIGEILGDPCEHISRRISFTCSSCNRFWNSSDYKLVKDDSGIYSFVKNEETRKRGEKKTS